MKIRKLEPKITNLIAIKETAAVSCSSNGERGVGGVPSSLPPCLLKVVIARSPRCDLMSFRDGPGSGVYDPGALDGYPDW